VAISTMEFHLLELINRARMDPAGEAARHGISLNQGLAPGTISSAPKQVLAMDSLLALSSEMHTKWMIAYDQYTTQEGAAFPTYRTGQTPLDRMVAAGYTFDPTPVHGEALSWAGTATGDFNLLAFINELFRTMFLSPGTRAVLLNPDFQEAGLGMENGLFRRNGINYDAVVLTNDFAQSGNKVFVTGVKYQDTPYMADNPHQGANDGQFSYNEGSGYRIEYTPNQGATTISLTSYVKFEPDPDYTRSPFRSKSPSAPETSKSTSRTATRC
jgi:serralysin